MEKYYPRLNREFYSVNPSLKHRSKIVIRCLKCGMTWEVAKIDAEKDHGTLQLLDHEYKHHNEET